MSADIQAQSPPTALIGSDGSDYRSYAPDVAVGAGLPAQATEAGNCLKTDGTALSWGACGSGGTPTPLSNATPQAPGTAAPGTATAASRGDHVHPLQAVPQPGTANPADAGTAAPGTSALYSRQDHVHKAQTVPQPGTANPLIEGTAAPGTSALYSRQDHVHPTGGGGGGTVTEKCTATASTAALAANDLAAGELWAFWDNRSTNSTNQARYLFAMPAKGSNANVQITTYNGNSGRPSNDGIRIVRAANGAITFAQAENYVVPQIGPVLCTGAGGGGGGGSGPALSNATPQVETVTGAAGTADTASRGDHAHPARLRVSTAIPKPDAGTGNPGSLGVVSRGDHVHPAAADEVPTPKVADAGKAIRINLSGTGYETRFVGDLVQDGLPTLQGQADRVLTVNNAATGIEWTNKGSGASVSNAVPKALGTAAAGTGTGASRDDHVHPNNLPTLTGHAGNVLTVNSSANGVEWKAAGGGGGGGGALSGTTTTIWSGTIPNNFDSTSFTADGNSADMGRLATFLSSTEPRFLYYEMDRGAQGITYSSFVFYLDDLGTCTAGTIRQVNFPYAGEFSKLAASGDAVQTIPYAQFQYRADGNCNIQSLLRFRFSLNNVDWRGNLRGSTLSLKYITLTGGGGGGGGTAPSIPTPTAAGALKHLRVNAAGAAYELADPPDTQSISDELDAVQRTVSDLTPYPSSDDPTFTDNTAATNAKITFALGNSTTPDLSSNTFVAADPGAQTGRRGYFVVAVSSGHDKARYRVRFLNSGGEAYEFPGNGWQSITPRAGAESGFTYWATTPIGEVIGATASVRLQAAANENHVGKTTYAGDPLAVSPWAKAGLGNGRGLQALGMNQAGTEPAWFDPLTLQTSGVPGSATWPGERGAGGQASRWDHRHPQRERRFTIKSGTDEDCCNDNFIELCVSDAEKTMAIAPFRVANWHVDRLELFLEYDVPNNADGDQQRFKFSMGAFAPGNTLPALPSDASTIFYGGYAHSKLHGANFEIWPDGDCRINFETIQILPGRDVKYRLDAVIRED